MGWMPRKIACTVALDLSQIERIDQISKRTRISRSELVREALDGVLAKYEDQLKLFDTATAAVAKPKGRAARGGKR